MYESEMQNQGFIEKSAGGLSCKMPTNQFRVHFQATNDFEKGFVVGIIVDGVLCTSKEAALQLAEKRIAELCSQWETQIAKM